MRLLVFIATMLLCGTPLIGMDAASVQYVRNMCGNNCGEIGTMQCSGCKSELYCSAVCQKQGWKRHKQRCKYVQDSQKNVATAHKKKQYKKARNKDAKLFKMALDKLDKELIKALIAVHTEYLNEPAVPVRHKKEIALFYAVEKGECKLVTFLVEEYYGQISLLDKTGLSALHKAVMKDNLEMARCLVDLGIKTDRQDELSEEKATILGILYGNSSSNVIGTPLHDAAMDGKLAFVKFFVEECKVPIDIVTELGTTPLMRAVQAGRTKVAKYLIKQGASPLAKDKTQGVTVLHLALNPFFVSGKIALNKPSKEFLEFLITDCGLDVNIVDNKGDTPLHHAAHYASVPAAKILIEELGADSTRRNKAGRTPLDHARFTKQQFAEDKIPLGFDKKDYNHKAVIQYFAQKAQNDTGNI